MDDYQELIELLKKYNRWRRGEEDWSDDDRGPDPKELGLAIDSAANVIESLLAENERLKHNLSTTEQTMREYQELAAKRLEEIAKYRGAPVVAVKLTWGGLELKDVYSTLPKGTQLIVKPGEEK